ncbi:hypothetical protein LINGRAHAP2_LOCUS30661 [Linum grandiflorum]
MNWCEVKHDIWTRLNEHIEDRSDVHSVLKMYTSQVLELGEQGSETTVTRCRFDGQVEPSANCGSKESDLRLYGNGEAAAMEG